MLSMKKCLYTCLFTISFLLLSITYSSAQCSICTKTAQQLGEKPAKGMNTGILYLAAAPFIIGGFVYYRWKKSSHAD
jgi:hypothetical protein